MKLSSSHAAAHVIARRINRSSSVQCDSPTCGECAALEQQLAHEMRSPGLSPAQLTTLRTCRARSRARTKT